MGCQINKQYLIVGKQHDCRLTCLCLLFTPEFDHMECIHVDRARGYCCIEPPSVNLKLPAALVQRKEARSLGLVGYSNKIV